MDPPSGHVQSIAVMAEAAREAAPGGVAEVADPLPKRTESAFTYLPRFSRAGCDTPALHACMNTCLPACLLLS